MNWGKVFAWAIILLSVAAAVGYACAGDWRRAGYWACGAGLTFSVTV